MSIDRIIILTLITIAALIVLEEVRNGNDQRDKDVVNEFNKICIEGYVYFEKTLTYQGYLAPKLNDNGSPVKCMKEKK